MIKVKSVDNTKSFIESEGFSSLQKLLRVTAYVLLFLKNGKGSPSERNTGVLSAEELNEAKVLWIKRTRHEDFRDELVYLKGSEVLPKKNRLDSLSSYLTVRRD